MDILLRREEESYVSYLKRILNLVKDKTITYDEMGDCLLGDKNCYSSENLRKAFYVLDKIADNLEEGSICSSEEMADFLDEKKRELEKARIKYRDERNEWQKQNRLEARVEQKLDYLEEVIIQRGREEFPHLDKIELCEDGSKELIACLSDLHIGQCFHTPFGDYDSDVAKRRLEEYLQEIIRIGRLHKAKVVNVVLLGDEISGNIHKTIQVSNRENVINQIELASEYVTNFCYQLTMYFSKVNFYSVNGNHSRMDRKEEAVKDERLDDLVAWFTRKMLSHIPEFSDKSKDRLDSTLDVVNICNCKFMLVHGDIDSITKSSVGELALMTNTIPDYILCGHIHSPAMQDLNGVGVYRSGSLAGSGDDYTIQHRLSGRPSQKVLVCDDDGIVCDYNVRLE